MKKILSIVVLSLFWCNTGLTEYLGKDKTVDYYLNQESYMLHSTGYAADYYIYHLLKNESKGPNIITCNYIFETKLTYCFAP